MKINSYIICIFAALLLFVGSCANGRHFSDEILIDRVIKSKKANEISPMGLTKRERLNFMFEIGAKLINIIKTNPENNQAWVALHHFYSLTDLGLRHSFQDDCFDAIKGAPFIFYDRYVNYGERNALYREHDALQGYLIDDGNIKIQEIKNREHIENMISLIKQQIPNANQRKRHVEFLNMLESWYKHRKQVFKEHFGELN